MEKTAAPSAFPEIFIGDQAISPLFIVVTAAALVLLVLLTALILTLRGRRLREEVAIEAQRREAEAAARMADLLRSQAEMQGRLAAISEVFGNRQAEFNQAISQRLDGMTHRLGTSINEQTKSTHENLLKLQERLAVIDAAQNNIQSLAKDVVSLQAILSNKQTRGAFGQSRMEAIISDGLPMGAFEFQPTLSNSSRPDCTVRMPNDAPPLVIDAKFPLEAWNSFRDSDYAEDRKTAAQQFRRDMDVHIRDISEKYLIPGETQDMAFLFVPSESIFAEIHEHFETVVQRAQRAKIVIVSPSLLMLSLQVIQAVLKDQRMREQAHLIQGEVLHLMEDLGRLDDRTRKLQAHFLAAQRDVEMIMTSADKITKRGAKIEALEFEAISPPSSPTPAPVPVPDRAAESRTGLLKLRVVDED
ncbi:DNA recombination protein RmuC [Rhizobium sp. RU36D]|uniref:DNA recombination protein RmuC n=1 Tax=Rhizobium sp. RU36D TaxID=1907415 RepID=UPI0009D85F99|nr:DNA recombination protein RmuC [Rhizobium sp. RU36D]SMD04422.1 DNA recombination protein RmuC [Rhizobium sp. RU36D]